MKITTRRWTTRTRSAIMAKHGTTLLPPHPRADDAAPARGCGRDRRRPAWRGARAVHRAFAQPRARRPGAEAGRAPALGRKAAAKAEGAGGAGHCAPLELPA